MRDEPLDRWADRRAKRLRAPGTRKAVHLGNGPHRAAHFDPAAPRLIVEWDGFAWQPVTTVENYAAACRMLNPLPEPPKSEDLPTTRAPVAKGTGRHRKS